MAVTDEDLFGDLSTLQTIDETLATPVDTSIDEPTSVGEIPMVTPNGYDPDMMGEMPEYDPSKLPSVTVPVQQVSSATVGEDTIVTPTSYEDEEFKELDPRLQNMLKSGDFEAEARAKEARGTAAAAEYRQRPDVIAQVERYEMMFAAAQNEDKITGGNRAAMIINPLATVDAENYKAELHIEHFKNAVEEVNYLLEDANPLRAAAVNKMLDKGVVARR